MADRTPQSFANHSRFDPLFHFFLIPIFAIGLVMTLVHFFAHITESDLRDNIHSFLLIVLAAAFLVWCLPCGS